MGKLMRAFQGWHEAIQVKTVVYEWVGCRQKHTVQVHTSADDGSIAVEKYCNGIRHYLREFSSSDSGVWSMMAFILSLIELFAPSNDEAVVATEQMFERM